MPDQKAARLRAQAQSAAKTVLVGRHLDEYRVIYQEKLAALKRIAYPENIV